MQSFSYLKLSILLLAVINCATVFFNWIEVVVTSDLNLYIFSSRITESLKMIKGIDVPGGYVALVIGCALAVLAVTGNRLGSVLSIVALINGVGYAMGWFIKKTELLSETLIDNILHVKVLAVPQDALFIYLLTSALISILFFFYKSK